MADTKLTPAVHQQLKVLLAQGLHRVTACGAVRITPKTLRNWLDRGEQGEEPFASFALDIAEAEAAYEAGLQDSIRMHAPEDYKAAAFLIERRFPKNWGAKQAIEHSGPDGAPIALSTIVGTKAAVDSNDLGDDVD